MEVTDTDMVIRTPDLVVALDEVARQLGTHGEGERDRERHDLDRAEFRTRSLVNVGNE